MFRFSFVFLMNARVVSGTPETFGPQEACIAIIQSRTPLSDALERKGFRRLSVSWTIISPRSERKTRVTS